MMDNFPLIARLHEETKKPMHIPFNEKDWPLSWKIVEFKEYPRMPQTPLPEPQTPSSAFGDVLKRRLSTREFDKNATLSLEELSTFLHWSAGISRNKERPEFSRRFYPSGGGRYSLELYLSLRGNDDVETGVYHYNVKKHTLEKIHDKSADTEIRKIPNYPWVKDSSAVLFITAIPHRVSDKYKERAYRFIHLEAGALIHNVYVVSAAMGLGCCAQGGILDDTIKELLDLRGEEEMLLHMSIGKAPQQKGAQAP